MSLGVSESRDIEVIDFVDNKYIFYRDNWYLGWELLTKIQISSKCTISGKTVFHAENDSHMWNIVSSICTMFDWNIFYTYTMIIHIVCWHLLVFRWQKYPNIVSWHASSIKPSESYEFAHIFNQTVLSAHRSLGTEDGCFEIMRHWIYRYCWQ